MIPTMVMTTTTMMVMMALLALAIEVVNMKTTISGRTQVARPISFDTVR